MARAIGPITAGLVLCGGVTAHSHEWSGMYAGINTGVGFGSFEYSTTYQILDDRWTEADDLKAFGLMYGAQAGYNHAFRSFVLGVEADFQFTGILAHDHGYIDYGWSREDIRVGTNVDWFATIRPRVGILFDRVMVYGTGGLAVGRMEEFVEYFGDEPERYEGGADIKPGWVAGAGVEYAMTDRLRLKTEYFFTAFDRRRRGANPGNDVVRAHTDIGFHAVRIGVNWAF